VILPPPLYVPHWAEAADGGGSYGCDEKAGPTRVIDSAAEAPSAAAKRRPGRLLPACD
jgi:hypothetical protein